MPSNTKPKARRHCAVCGSRDHTRTAHGWSGRNMDPKLARQLAQARRAA